MKILAIMGSPHCGNTYELTQRIEEKLVRFNDVEFEYIHLKDVQLQPCRGCYLCFYNGEDHCPLDDDKKMIAQKLEEADGVVFVSPVYSMQVTYLFKMFVDRFAYTFHRPRYWGKYAIVVAAAGNPGLKETLKYLKMVAGVWGFEVVGELGYYAMPQITNMQPLMNKKDRTDDVVNKFYHSINEHKPKKLGLKDYIFFRSCQAVYGCLGEKSPTE